MKERVESGMQQPKEEVRLELVREETQPSSHVKYDENIVVEAVSVTSPMSPTKSLKSYKSDDMYAGDSFEHDDELSP